MSEAPIVCPGGGGGGRGAFVHGTAVECFKSRAFLETLSEKLREVVFPFAQLRL